MSPNSPRPGTRPRSFVCADELWQAAQAKAASNDETVARVLRRALREYVAEPPTTAEVNAARTDAWRERKGAEDKQ